MKVVPNMKKTFSIAFNLVSKLRSFLIAATGIAGAGFILTISDAEGIPVAVIVVERLRVTRVLLLVLGAVARLFIVGKVSDIMSLIR